MSEKKFSTDAAKAFIAIVVLMILAIAPAVVIAVWRAIL